MSAVVIKLNVLKPELKRLTEGAALRGLKAMGLVGHRIMRAGLSTPNTGERHTRTRNTSVGKKGSSYTTYPHSAVRPAPPHLRTGFLASHIFHEFDPQSKTFKIGVRDNAIYGYYLQEQGWKWIPELLLQNASQLQQAFLGAAKI